ncbi:kinase domain protein [Aspergillus fijiensis CBS 313.89]|uniref:non-specific serine/threonine protein kinase n=1 Tax=Aspergillus fijiensis CBS 313.89 TaxID=1448319 RepID=A0A8G1RRR8_9EURO|nr:kinase domain protein [Aspergillus fijiensis CBS 313.89]RAK77699.1 kinase domain protein [Aspergillus fijiensis CBS 313.89]
MSSLRSSLPRFSPLLCKRLFSIPSHGPPSPPGILVDEEISPFYNTKCLYPAKPGEVLADRYHIVVKVGWGVSSTAWLALDLQRHIEEPETIVALKIANNNAHYAGHEREVEEHISTADPSHRGRSLIRTLLNSFQGPEGSHSCLVYPPLREPLSRYQQHFVDGRMPLPLIKSYIRTLLSGLDYLHQECRVVHTDLKLENIMSQLARPMASKIDSTGRPVYQSRNVFGPLKSLKSIPQLVDFGLATRLAEDDDWGIWPIQPDHYRAPEVILGIGWQMPADIWNLGVLRYQSMREFSLPGPLRREDGRVCETAEEYFCRFLYEDLIPDRRLGDTVSFLQGEEREAFLDLVGKMLLWNHNYRRLAGELAGHPFLQPQN